MADAEVDISQLTEEQQLALQQFTSVTDQDLAVAVPLLRRCEWNVQIAIARFFDGESSEPVAAEPDSPPPRATRRRETLMNGFSDTRSSSWAAHRAFDPAPRIVNQPQSQIAQRPAFPLSLVVTPLKILWSIFAKTFGFLSYLFPFLPRLLARFTARTSLSGRTSSSRTPQNTQHATSRFIREFEEAYGAHELPLLDLSYAQAFDRAKRELQFLLVIPISPEHDDTRDFIQHTLLAPAVVEFLKDPTYRILLWAGTVQESEAYQVATALNFTEFPAAGLIVHTTAGSSTSMSVVARIQGLTTPEEFLGSLRTAIAQHSEALDRTRAAQSEHQASRNLREAQNSAYEKSLAQDRERLRLKREAEAAQQKAQQAEKDRAQAADLYARNIAQWRQWRAQSIPAEPDASNKDTVRISLRMPSGERVMRRFDSEAHIEEVYAFVECYDLLKEAELEAVSSEKGVTEPQGFDHQYKFRLVSPMPREVYSLEDGGSVRERVGRSGNLIVERTQDEDEDEDN